MTDKELIQALRCCDSGDCCNCPAEPHDSRCVHEVRWGAVADRLEALLAENEQLEKMVNRHELFGDALPAANEALIAENDHFRDLAKMIVWHDTRECLPQKCGDYIVHVMHAVTSTSLYYMGHNNWVDDHGNSFYRVTHWIEFPSPPSTERKRYV